MGERAACAAGVLNRIAARIEDAAMRSLTAGKGCFATEDIAHVKLFMSRPAQALLAITCLFVGILGFFWLRQPPSNQELLANYAKVADYANAAASVHALPWWTPNYLQGCSLAFASLGALTNLALFTSVLVAGPYSGAKLAALAFLFLCPLTMFAFIRRLCPGSGWTAFSCGAAYLFAPAILIRLGHVEHVANVLAFAMIPVAFLSILVFLEQRSAWSAILCATANSLLVLAYAKIAVLTLPLLAAFALWVWMARAHFTPPSRRNVLLCAGAFLILGGLPNFPSLRETRFIAKFDFGPFSAWQKGYSAESVLSWMDRESRLTGARVSAQSEVRTNASYLGIAGLACATALFFFRRRPAWQTSEATVFRLFMALTFLAHWLGLGVNTALSGQFAFLSDADSAWDPAVAISWGLLVRARGGNLDHRARVSSCPALVRRSRDSRVFLHSGIPIDRKASALRRHSRTARLFRNGRRILLFRRGRPCGEHSHPRNAPARRSIGGSFGSAWAGFRGLRKRCALVF